MQQGDQAMVTIGMNYEILEGKEAPFEKMFAKVIELMNETRGHLVTHLYRDVWKARSYLIVSEWQTQQDFDAFLGSDAFRKTAAWGKESILASRPAHQVYESKQMMARPNTALGATA